MVGLSSTQTNERFSNTMSVLPHSHHEARRCSRCFLKLTDSTSYEMGIGPICAKKNAVLYARTIPANYGTITLLLHTLNVSTIPDLQTEERNPRAEFLKIKESLQVKARRAISGASMQDLMTCSITGEDLKGEVRVIDWLCSYDMGHETKKALVSIVKATGFVGLSAVLGGEASTGEANISFDGQGWLTLEGSRCKSGWRSFSRLAHLGVVLPTYGKRTYRVPSALVSEFVDIVQEYWPMFEQNLQEVIDQAVAWNTVHPSSVSHPTRVTLSGGPVATLKKDLVKGEFSVSFPWTGRECFKVVEGLKAVVPSHHRKYNPTTKAWTIHRFVYETKVSEVLVAGGFEVERVEA